MDERLVVGVTGTVTLRDGQGNTVPVSFQITEEGTSRWGATAPWLGAAVHPTEAMEQALSEWWDRRP